MTDGSPTMEGRCGGSVVRTSWMRSMVFSIFLPKQIESVFSQVQGLGSAIDLRNMTIGWVAQNQ